MRARGVRVLYDEPRRGTAGSRINFLHPKDCGGVLVELVEVLEPATHGPSRGVEEPPVSDTGSQPAPPA
jgi:methylmalonyl-CoA/ethylmalonyl-CoA epimerase